jgi:hypothetical protein
MCIPHFHFFAVYLTTSSMMNNELDWRGKDALGILAMEILTL